MGNFSNNNPGVVSIQMFSKANLPKNAIAKAAVGIKSIMPLSRTDISFFGVPTVSTSKKIENNGEICEVTLQFKSSEDIPFHGYGFGVKTMAGKHLLIGSDTKEPVVEREESTGSPDGEAAVYEYKISVKDVIAPIEVVL